MTQRPWFDILEVIGSGTYGVVCIARDLRQPQQPLVALKVLRPDHVDDERVQQRTRDEARILVMLRHSNVIEVTELLDVEERPVIVMEYIPGVSLFQLLSAYNRPLPTAVAVEVIRQAALALDATYSKPIGPQQRPMRIIHRDIKPSNILLSVQGQVKLLDYGIAKAFFLGRESETFSVVLGTRGYMSPERIDGGPDSPAGDVFALGLVLLELLVGQPTPLSIDPRMHRERLTGYLAMLKLDDVILEVKQVLFEIIEGMCAYELKERMRPADAARALGRLLTHTGLEPRLSSFARRFVLPLHDQRGRLTPTAHPSWSELEFLQAPRAYLAKMEAERGTTPVIRRFLELPGWLQRMTELEDYLNRHPDWSAKPFLDLLQLATDERECFWLPPPGTEHILAALHVLRARKTAEVVARLRTLLNHRDPKVVAAVRHALMSDVVPPNIGR